MEFRFSGQRIAVNVPDWEALRAEVTGRLQRGEGFALATINLDHLVKLRGSARFRAAYGAQDLVTADGNPIVWMSRLAGRSVSLIPGSDAILPLTRIAVENGVSIALLGSTEDSLSAAADYLAREVPGARVICRISPPMGFDPTGATARALLEQVAQSGAGLCFVALGAPRQEQLSALGREVAPAVGFASIGAGLDFFAGTQKRAPDWARRYQIEWLWRMLSSPGRLGARYLKCMAILPGQMLRAILMRFAG